MLIVCPSCATSYDVELASLSPDGRQVRCVRCRSVWHAEPNHADKLVAAAAAISTDQGVGNIADEPGEPAMAELGALDEGADAAPGALQEEEASQVDAADHDPAPTAVAAEALSEPEAEPADVEAPPIAPADMDGVVLDVDVDSDGVAEPPAEDIETVAARRQRRGASGSSLRWPLSRLKTGILALALIDIILLGWRGDVVRVLPQTASLYALLGLPVNLRGLTFEDVATTTEQHEGVPIVVVEGYVHNTARRTEDVPRLKFVVRNAARQEIYSWTAVPARTLLQPGEAVAFRTRLASPPPDAHDLVLRFVNRRDIVAGAR
jgi:predicted Zn finger-like uncharacterized protein